ncbi:MAG: thiamine-phosphate kinase [Alphaproteobacteria bacterium]
MTERPKRNEFDRIATYFAPLAAGFPGAYGLTDDAAVIAPAIGTELVVTTDTIVAGIHYIGDEAPGLVAAKLLRVNLSDLAAKGATPLAYTLNVAFPPSLDDDWVADFTAGLAVEQAEFGIALIGGDSVSTTGPVTLTLTAFGTVPAGGAILRNGARPGDTVFVSGSIGDGALGLKALQDRLPELLPEYRGCLVGRYQRPQPRCILGPRLRGLAHAAADISDGLVADLENITDASGVAARIFAERVPLSEAAAAVLQDDPSLLANVLTGGDDYELVFAAPDSALAALNDLAREIGVPVTAIGRIEDGDGVTVLDSAGLPMALTRLGYTHE